MVGLQHDLATSQQRFRSQEDKNGITRQTDRIQASFSRAALPSRDDETTNGAAGIIIAGCVETLSGAVHDDVWFSTRIYRVASRLYCCHDTWGDRLCQRANPSRSRVRTDDDVEQRITRAPGICHAVGRVLGHNSDDRRAHSQREPSIAGSESSGQPRLGISDWVANRPSPPKRARLILSIRQSRTLISSALACYITNTLEPVVLRASKSRCACAASAKA